MLDNTPFTHIYSWHFVPDQLVPLIMKEFAGNGATHLVLANIWSQRLLNEPGFYSRLTQWLRSANLQIFECHAPYGMGYDLNITDFPRRRGMVEDHKICIEYAAMFGCRTYTIHLGAYYPGMEKYAAEALEKLLPFAEEQKIIIAIENGFYPGNQPEHLRWYTDRFPSPYFGCCFDTGHANIMFPRPDWDIKRHPVAMQDIWQHDMIQEADPIGKIADLIVTAHLHDNDGYSDSHMCPGDGTVDWKSWIPALKKCPRLQSLQAEAASVIHGNTVKRLCQTFEELIKL